MSKDVSIAQIPNEDTLLSIRRYLEVLIDNYPEGLTQKELAERADVSPSAVSKVKEKLFPLCDIEALAYNSKLVLNPDFRTFEVIISKQLEENNLLNLLKLISTKYGEKVINEFDIHNYIVSKYEMYKNLFNEKETKLTITIFLRFIRSLKIMHQYEKIERTLRAIHEDYEPDTKNEDFLFGLLLGYIFKKADFEWPIESEDEIKIIVGLRDKMFYISKFFLTKITENLSVFDLFTKKEKKIYEVLCDKIIDYYLRKIFSEFTESLELTVAKNNMLFNHSYKEIGSLVPKSSIIEILEKITQES